MYIEILHDAQGNIVSCYEADTLPASTGEPLFTLMYPVLDAKGKPTGDKTAQHPAGHEQVRINIDTLTAMEIDENCGPKAVINPATNQPEIVNVSRQDYIRQTFMVDVAGAPKTHVKPLKNIPVGMKVRGLVRKP